MPKAEPFSLAQALAAAEEIERRSKAQTWCPQKPTPRQRAFLDVPALEAFYGGAAGGGKSSALLMGALQYVHVPGYAAILFRRTYQDLSLPGSLMDRADQWLRDTDAHWSGTDKRWTFPSGATLSFGYLDNETDKFRYKSAEFQFVGFDELTQMLETQYRYVISRVRRLQGATVPLRVRSASNPGDRGHDWVKAYFVEPGDPSRPFIPALLDDNPHLDRVEYRAALARLDRTTRDQLERGIWARDTMGLIYPYSAVNLVPELPALDGWQWGLGIDLGSSEIKPTTALVLVAWQARLPGLWAVRSEVHAGMIPSALAERVQEIDSEVGGLEIITCDEGALGKGYAGEMRDRHSLAVIPAEKHNKLGFRKLLRGALEDAQVMLVEPQCGPLLDEMGSLVWNAQGLDNDPKSCNHCTDALLYIWRQARPHVCIPPKHKPKEGSKEWAAEQAAAMERQEDEELAEHSRMPAWARW